MVIVIRPGIIFWFLVDLITYPRTSPWSPGHQTFYCRQQRVLESGPGLVLPENMLSIAQDKYYEVACVGRSRASLWSLEAIYSGCVNTEENHSVARDLERVMKLPFTCNPTLQRAGLQKPCCEMAY